MRMHLNCIASTTFVRSLVFSLIFITDRFSVQFLVDLDWKIIGLEYFYSAPCQTWVFETPGRSFPIRVSRFN